MREMRVTTIQGKVYLFPVPVIKERKYLILCSTENEAYLISKAIQEGLLVHPDLISSDFVYFTHHTDNQTKIYYLNPKINIQPE